MRPAEPFSGERMEDRWPQRWKWKDAARECVVHGGGEGESPPGASSRGKRGSEGKDFVPNVRVKAEVAGMGYP